MTGIGIRQAVTQRQAEQHHGDHHRQGIGVGAHIGQQQGACLDQQQQHQGQQQDIGDAIEGQLNPPCQAGRKATEQQAEHQRQQLGKGNLTGHMTGLNGPASHAEQTGKQEPQQGNRNDGQQGSGHLKQGRQRAISSLLGGLAHQ